MLSGMMSLINKYKIPPLAKVIKRAVKPGESDRKK